MLLNDSGLFPDTDLHSSSHQQAFSYDNFPSQSRNIWIYMIYCFSIIYRIVTQTSLEITTIVPEEAPVNRMWYRATCSIG